VVIQPKTLGLLLTAAGFAFIAAMTLVPHPELVEEVRKLPNMCLVCGEQGGQDVILNILLFIPLGIGLRLAGLNAWKAFGVSVLTSFAVETLQYTVIAGRHASLSDLLTNSSGGGLGILLVDRWRGLIFPGPAASRRLAWLGIGIWLALEMVSVSLLSIAPPKTIYRSEWAPVLPWFDQFRGEVSRATLNGDLILGALPDEGRKVGARLAKGGFVLEVAGTGDGGSGFLAPIMGVFDEKEQEILIVGEWGRDLIFRVRMRVSDLGLRNPALRLPDVLPAVPGKPLEIRAGLNRGRLFIQLARDGQESRRELALSPNWGWSFLLPNEYAFGYEVHFLTALWIAGLLLPLAYWARRGATTSTEQWRASALLAALIALGIGAVPLATRIPAVHWSEWLAAVTGLLAGWWLASVVLRFDNARARIVVPNSCTVP
jgi:hypothetical protein